MIININDIATVMLTKLGENILLSNSMYSSNYDFESKKLKIELWELMNIFGKYLYIGSEQVFVNNELELESWSNNKTSIC